MDGSKSSIISIHALLAESDIVKMSIKVFNTDFYPRSPCGERLMLIFTITVEDYFYPRSPCGERQRAENHANSQQEFLSTLSLRRATKVPLAESTAESISIHALLAESDKPAEHHANSQQEFLSTLSLRRATSGRWKYHNTKF